VEKITINFWDFYLWWIWFKLCCRQTQPKYRSKFAYRPIFKRSNIGGPIYRLVSTAQCTSI